MPMEVNAVRGEVAAKVGGVSIVMAATMEDVARLSNAIGNPTFPDLGRRLLGVEIVATMAALRLFIRRGEAPDGSSLPREKAVETALANYRFSDNNALQAAFAEVMEPLTQPAGGGDTAKNG